MKQSALGPVELILYDLDGLAACFATELGLVQDFCHMLPIGSKFIVETTEKLIITGFPKYASATMEHAPHADTGVCSKM